MRKLICCALPNSSSELCLPATSAPMSWTYNIIAMAGAFSLSPPPFPSNQPLHALSVGLGGGELHTALLAYFSSMHVTSVDVSEKVVAFALDHFGMDQQVCGMYELANNTITQRSTSSANSGQSSALKQFSYPEDCRSNVVVADIWQFIDRFVQAERSPQEAAVLPQHYHYIVFDTFDSSPSHWNGELYAGSSNALPVEEKMESTLLDLRSMLHPAFGVAAFHIHKDGLYRTYLETIEKVFGKHRTAVLDMPGDSIIVASRADFFVHSSDYNAYLPPDDPIADCAHDGNDDPLCFAVPSEEERSADQAYQPLFHPCVSPRSVARRTIAFGEAVGFPLKWQMMASYAVNCTEHRGSA